MGTDDLFKKRRAKLQERKIATCGEGKNTISLVNATSKIVARSPIMYEQVWVVFDKDDFEAFDEAIELAKNNGFFVGWSNQCFEYWIYLHFNYSDSALHRSQWYQKLDEIFKINKISDEGYEKNLSNIFDIATKYGSLKFAISNAIRIEESYDYSILPSKRDPCSTVYKLIQELKPYIEPLIK